MTTAKILASYDDQGIQEEQGTTSGIEPSEEGAEYRDPITGRVLNAEDGAALLTLVQEQIGGFVNKADLKTSIADGKLSGDLRKTSGEEWECVVFDLSAYQDPQQAREIIIEALSNPEYKTRKNQGGGRFQDIEVKGKRGVIAWGIHNNQQGTGPHFHAFVHHHAIDGTKVCPRAKVSDTHILPMEEQAINNKLQAAGLAPLKMLTQGQSPSTPQAKAANAAVAAAVATGSELPPPVAGVAPTLSEVKLSFGELAQQKQNEAARLYQQAQQLAKESAIYEQAQRATDQFEKLAAEKEKLQENFAELNQNHTELAKKLHGTVNERNDLALALCNTLGLDEEKADLPAKELGELAGQQFDQVRAELEAEAKEAREAREADLTIIRQAGFDNPADLAQAFQAQEQENKGYKQDHENITKTLKGVGVASVDELATGFKMHKKAEENRQKVFEKHGVKTVEALSGLLEEQSKVATKASNERDAEKERADKAEAEATAERKAKEKAEAEAKKQAEELQKVRDALDAERKKASDLAKVLKSEQDKQSKLTTRNAELVGELKAVQQQNNRMNAAIEKMATRQATAPAGGKKPK